MKIKSCLDKTDSRYPMDFPSSYLIVPIPCRKNLVELRENQICCLKLASAACTASFSTRKVHARQGFGKSLECLNRKKCTEALLRFHRLLLSERHFERSLSIIASQLCADLTICGCFKTRIANVSVLINNFINFSFNWSFCNRSTLFNWTCYGAVWLKLYHWTCEWKTEYNSCAKSISTISTWLLIKKSERNVAPLSSGILFTDSKHFSLRNNTSVHRFYEWNSAMDVIFLISNKLIGHTGVNALIKFRKLSSIWCDSTLQALHETISYIELAQLIRFSLSIRE